MEAFQIQGEKNNDWGLCTLFQFVHLFSSRPSIFAVWYFKICRQIIGEIQLQAIGRVEIGEDLYRSSLPKVF